MPATEGEETPPLEERKEEEEEEQVSSHPYDIMTRSQIELEAYVLLLQVQWPLNYPDLN